MKREINISNEVLLINEVKDVWQLRFSLRDPIVRITFRVITSPWVNGVLQVQLPLSFRINVFYHHKCFIDINYKRKVYRASFNGKLHKTLLICWRFFVCFRCLFSFYRLHLCKKCFLSLMFLKIKSLKILNKNS